MLLTRKNEARRDRTVPVQSIRGGELEIEYTSKALSGWGGLALVYEFGAPVGFFRELARVMPNAKTSPNQVSSLDVVKTLFATVLSGGNRFADVDRIRGDEVIRRVMELHVWGVPTRSVATSIPLSLTRIVANCLSPCPRCLCGEALLSSFWLLTGRPCSQCLRGEDDPRHSMLGV